MKLALRTAAVLVILLLSVQMPQAHSWYSNNCCHDRDCAPLPDGAVEATSAGWRLIETGEIVPYGGAKERDSQDSHFHLCRPHGQGKVAPIRCLYVPQFGS